MKKPSYFSMHAFNRVSQRTKLSCFDIANILENMQYVLLGSKPGLTKQYLLFYSELDAEYFVVLQDVINGTVITVLPLEYHENLAWVVTESQKIKARELATTIQCYKSDKPSYFVVSAGYIADDGALKVKELKKFYINLYGEDIVLLIKSHLDKFELTEMTLKKSIDYKMVVWFSIRLGKKGARISFLPPEK